MHKDVIGNLFQQCLVKTFHVLHFNTDINALVVLDGRLIAGLADGRAVALAAHE